MCQYHVDLLGHHAREPVSPEWKSTLLYNYVLQLAGEKELCVNQAHNLT